MPEQIVWVVGDPYLVVPGKSCRKCDLGGDANGCLVARGKVSCRKEGQVLKETAFPLEKVLEGVDEQCGVGNG